jgi:antitoxin PrlF
MDVHYHGQMANVLEADAKVTAQNQLTIPAPFRKIMGLQGGVNHVKFRYTKGKISIVMVKHSKKTVPQDETLQPFLKLLAHDMIKNPRRIIPLPSGLLSRAQAATAGIQVDLDAPLTGDD